MKDRGDPPRLGLPKGELAARNSALRNRRIGGTVVQREKEREREREPRRAVCIDETARRHRRCTCCNNVPGLIHRWLSASSDSCWSPVQNQPRFATHTHTHTHTCTCTRSFARESASGWANRSAIVRMFPSNGVQGIRIRSEKLETVKSVGKRLAICLECRFMLGPAIESNWQDGI